MNIMDHMHISLIASETIERKRDTSYLAYILNKQNL